jgi:hypothetical protein
VEIVMSRRHLRSADELIFPEVEQSLADLGSKLTKADKAVAQLARRYAATIDAAYDIATDLDAVPADEDLAGRVAWLARKVEAQTVLETLGPKLLACLEALGASPRARAAQSKGTGSGAGTTSKLTALREARGA